MARVGLIMAGLALVTVTLSMLIPLLGWFIVAPLTALTIGAGAGWWASKVMGYGTAGRGAAAGTLAGLGALFGAVIGLVILALIAANNPELQREMNRAMDTVREQNPDQNIGDIPAGALLTASAVLFGGCIGLINLFLSMLGGLIAGVIYGRNRGAAVATSAGTYPGAPLPPDAGVTTKLDSEHTSQIYSDDQRRD
jgi:hypothetical protein